MNELLVIQKILDSNSSSISEDSMVDDSIATFTNHTFFTEIISGSLKLSQSIPSSPPKVRNLRPNYTGACPERRRGFANASSTSFALSAGNPIGENHDAVLRFAEIHLDLRDWVVVMLIIIIMHDLLDFLRNDRGLVASFRVLVVSFLAAGSEAEREEE